MHATSLFKIVPTAAFLSIEALGTSLASVVQSIMSTMDRYFCNLVIARVTSIKCENKKIINQISRFLIETTWTVWTSGRKDLCMVPCHSCHIYGVWTSRSKKVCGEGGGGVLKSHQLGVAMQVTKSGTLFIGKAGSRYVILLYCETLLQFLLGLKDFIGYLFSRYYCCFTCLRLPKPKVQLKVS